MAYRMPSRNMVKYMRVTSPGSRRKLRVALAAIDTSHSQVRYCTDAAIVNCIGDGMPDDQLRQIEQVAVDAAAQAADFVGSRFGGKLDVSRKPEEGDTLVTDVDLASQRLIADIVAARFPAHRLLGEEDRRAGDAGRGATGGGVGTTLVEPAATEFVWAVDPIDGTLNFVNGLPFYAVSIGILHRGRPVAGACALPWPGTPRPIVIHARAGDGAWLGERRLRIEAPGPAEDGRPPLAGRVAALPGGLRRAYRLSKDYTKEIGEPRATGSAVYEQMLVALGVAQYSITGPAKIWDFAAGVLIVREAGGIAMTPARPGDGARADHWRPLESFVDTYDLTPETTKRMRAWHNPVLLGPPSIVEFVAANARPRRPSTLRRLRRRLLRRFSAGRSSRRANGGRRPPGPSGSPAP
jgi:myo-inositol-1(or 4)-monophosphatase